MFTLIDRACRAKKSVALAGIVAIVASGCALTTFAQREQTHSPNDRPWWCTATAWNAPDPGGPYSGQVKGDLTWTQCGGVSAALDIAIEAAYTNPTETHAIAAGLIPVSDYVEGTGVDYADPAEAIDDAFTSSAPEIVAYDGDVTGQLAGLGWIVHTNTGLPPDGFPGNNDWWSEAAAVCLGGSNELLELGGLEADCNTAGGTFHSSDYWLLRAWVIRPFQHHPDVFNPTHACLAASGPVYDVTDGCFTSSNTDPLDVLLTNDDGYSAAGIDEAATALLGLGGVTVEIVAPLVNQSGSGDTTTPGPHATSAEMTASGHPATAVDGKPADAVNVALDVLGVNPDLVVSGINDGDNTGTKRLVSGTVGAARTAGRRAIPAVATSQESGSPPDWPEGVDALLTWVEDFRLGRTGTWERALPSINIPTCTAGSIRGTLSVPSASTFTFSASDCTSALPAGDVDDDVEGFLNGFTVVSDVGLHN